MGRTASDREKFGDRGTIFVGKQFIKMGQTTALSNEVHMDMVRAHVLFIVGKRGCLTGDTKVFTNNGFKNIKDFNEKEDEVYSFNKEDKSFTWEKAELLEYPINNEDLIKFDLHNGHSVIATSEHPLLISKKERMIWKKAQDITKDDNVVGVINVPKSNNIFDLGIKDIKQME